MKSNDNYSCKYFNADRPYTGFVHVQDDDVNQLLSQIHIYGYYMCLCNMNISYLFFMVPCDKVIFVHCFKLYLLTIRTIY